MVAIGIAMALYVHFFDYISRVLTQYARPSQNWRAVLAILCSVPPTIPGLINSINPKIKVGGAVHLFDIAWIFGVSTLLAELAIMLI